MVRKLLLCLLAACLLPLYGWAVRIDTVRVKSPKMGRNVETVVVVPDKALRGEACPVLYLLHGYGGDAHAWLGIKPEVPRMSEEDGVIVVCPDGENSWYWDSPLHPESQYETFVSSELVAYIDAHYATLKAREARAVTGFSMGGHGALWLAIRHKDVFGAAGSTSGGVDIRPFPGNWEMKTQLGEEEKNPDVWEKHTVVNQLGRLKDGDLSLIIDCGADDFFIEVNRDFHKKLLDKGIAHDFIVRPGAHTASYWSNSIDYQWLFFKKFFAGYRFGKE